jgi:GT2 family glycosyltransferase
MTPNHETNLYIVMPVHNRKAFTKECLLSLRKQTVQEFATVVIDDGSSDGTGEMIQGQFPEVVLLKGDGNLWWAGATNFGIRYALDRGARYILTLNDDTLVEPTFIQTMVSWSQRNPSALLGALAVDLDTRKTIYAGEVINWLTASYRPASDPKFAKEITGLQEATHYAGRGLLIPARVFHEIGLFDAEHFPQTLADYDFTHRARKAGFKVYCTHAAKILIRTSESGAVKLRVEKSWSHYWSHLLGIKGAGNLKYFTLYAVRNCPRKYLPLFLPIGLLRRVFGYLFEWGREALYAPKKAKMVL